MTAAAPALSLGARSRAPSRVRTIRLADDRLLGYDDLGDTTGTPVLFFHGFGSSRLIRHPDDSIADALGIRIIAPDRPGIGHSTRQPGRGLLDWPRDVAQLADRLGLDRFSILGWSGGGPYALATAWALPERVVRCALVSAPAPLAGVPGAAYLQRSHRAAAHAAGAAPWMIRLAMWRWARRQQRDPQGHLDAAVAQMIEADRVVMEDPRLRECMLANVAEIYRQGGRGIQDEALIIARRWDFSLREIGAPVRLWHGDADPTVPVAMGRYLAGVLAGCEASFYPGEGHQLLFDRWSEILADLVA